jgi:hypothetical protein
VTKSELCRYIESKRGTNFEIPGANVTITRQLVAKHFPEYRVRFYMNRVFLFRK